MFLLDTDTIIYCMKGDTPVQEHLKRHYNDVIKISTVTLMELYYGAYKSQRVTSNLAKIKALEQSIEVVPIGGESVEIFGMLKAQLQMEGLSLDDFDLIIAACALASNLTLVTNNDAHFQGIEGLKLDNWTRQP